MVRKSKRAKLSHRSRTTDFITGSPLRELERKMSKVLGPEYKNYKQALETYEDFKRLRMELGKPPRTFTDPEAVTRDLFGEFSTLVKDIERKRNFDRRRSVFS